ncbi:histidine kinase [Aeromicrobium flavum]|uniref:histidine kinase n=1 Tax=Aeromicrobium flavum TaxID=416568 RepID=A0A512HX90_9ACTN|nr:sensor histidine kinase [Aeromicrobium flavum]GEO90068.1 histidine kinase [Aeromicrobium flavum]
MPSFEDIADAQTALTTAQIDRLQLLVTDWQIVADLSFSDLVLWVDDAEDKGMWAAAQIRPTTGPTTLLEDVVGTFVPRDVSDVHDEKLGDGTRVRQAAVPVMWAGRRIGVIVQRRPATNRRAAGALESAYRRTSEELFEMIRRGEFPLPGVPSELADSLRVGDGFVRTDSSGKVSYASPNALSAYRRLGYVGDLQGADLIELSTELIGADADRPFSTLFGAGETEAEIESGGASMLLRIMPLRSGGQATGSLILLRDVTELRLRERELVSKDATIREIHHRVKNNLQTVAALLRLQSRRMEIPAAREALQEAERRVGSIALVHETLSQSFDESVEFDAIADTLLRTVLDVGGGVVKAERVGSFGLVPAEIATPLAMTLTELVQNAAEHAFGPEGGRVTLAVNRIRGRIRLRVSDDGRGLPDDFDPTLSLGLSIVSTLVRGELKGELDYESSPADGTTVTIAFGL